MRQSISLRLSLKIKLKDSYKYYATKYQRKLFTANNSSLMVLLDFCRVTMPFFQN